MLEFLRNDREESGNRIVESNKYCTVTSFIILCDQPCCTRPTLCSVWVDSIHSSTQDRGFFVVKQFRWYPTYLVPRPP